jgi:hypothetical protein
MAGLRLRRLSWRSALLFGAVLVSAVLGGGAPPTAIAAETHVFDAGLSLTGGCTTSKVDPVPDPGCPEGSHPPSGSFSQPHDVATDFYGNIYVASIGKATAEETEGRIDVFDSQGFFITELADPVAAPSDLTVDSKGNLYIFAFRQGTTTSEGVARIVRYSPTLYLPGAGEISYEDPPVLVTERPVGGGLNGIAINPSNGHLFVNFGTSIGEFSSAAEGNELMDKTIGEGIVFNSRGTGLAVDSAHGRIYTSDSHRVRALELAPPHALLLTVDGSATPSGAEFANFLSVAADEGTGHLFIYDGEGANAVYEFTEDGGYVSTIDHSIQNVPEEEIAIDNGANSPNGALNPEGRYLFVPSHPGGVGHAFAFGSEPVECPPIVAATSFARVTQDEAELRATVDPCNGSTSYVFEYTTEQSFEEEGFAGALIAGEGQIPAGPVGVNISASAAGLSPDSAYRFRIVAANGAGVGQGEGEFTTYPALDANLPCSNDAVRTGLSAPLSDCRAYELVTPADTNARAPIGIGHLGIYFATREASPSGGKVSFQIEGGTIPGNEGTGAFGGDPYLASRGVGSWSTSSAGPNGVESPALLPGSTSPDQGYSFWSTGSGQGSASINGKSTSYVRYPDGHSELVGRGSLGTEPQAEGKLISEGGGHVIFSSNFFHPGDKLEKDAPPAGTQTIYDRTANEVTHVVSLLPGNVTPAAGQDAVYIGSSLDGTGVAFSIGSTIYLRRENSETYEVADEATFAGVAEGGSRIFYVKGGDLFAFDAQTESVIPFSASGNVTVVNVSANGTSAYFVSPSILATDENPNGDRPHVGKQNLYLSKEGSISFVGTLTKRDVEGDTTGNDVVEGLGLWTIAVGTGPYGGPGRFGEDPSRSTPDGSVILFEARAPLTEYNPDGHTEIYLYDSVREELACLSCNPTEAPASGAASLQSISMGQGKPEPFSSYALVANLRSDGRRAFFQSTEALVVTDTDGLQDVYEWEAQGVGSCTRPQGCIYLVSSGHSERVDYLYAVSDSGDDVFFRTSDLLLPSDTDKTPSIYDARVGGGFPEPKNEDCQGEGCRPSLAPAPFWPSPGEPARGAHDNVVRCPNGTKRVRLRGKVRCIRKSHKHRHNRHRLKEGAGKS